jgi:hypothetical protein
MFVTLMPRAYLCKRHLLGNREAAALYLTKLAERI